MIAKATVMRRSHVWPGGGKYEEALTSNRGTQC